MDITKILVLYTSGQLAANIVDGRRAKGAIFIHLIDITKILVLYTSGQLAANIVPYCIWNPSVKTIQCNGFARLNEPFERDIQ